MSKQWKVYRLTYLMRVPLTCTVNARNEEHARELADELADNGPLAEDDREGSVDFYDCTEVAP